MTVTEEDALRADLEAEGVDAADFGRFVNRVVPGIIEPSTFDAQRATPVLLRWLPRVQHPGLKRSIVGHLNTKAARGIAAQPLLEQFRISDDDHLRWSIGSTLQSVVTPDDYDDVVALAGDRSYGWSRQMLIDMLWRVKTDTSKRTLLSALDDPDVALHAGSALRRLLGNEVAAAHLKPLTEHDDPQVARAARQNLQRAHKALATRSR